MGLCPGAMNLTLFIGYLLITFHKRRGKSQRSAVDGNRTLWWLIVINSLSTNISLPVEQRQAVHHRFEIRKHSLFERVVRIKIQNDSASGDAEKHRSMK